MRVRTAPRSLVPACLLVALALAGCEAATPEQDADRAPELSTGLVDQFTLTPYLGSAPDQGPTAGRLITPHTNLQVTDVLVTDELDTSAASLLQLGSGEDTPRAAPDGYDVVVASISTRDLTSPFAPDPDAPPVFEITSGEERWTVEPFGSYFSTGLPTNVGYWTSPDATFLLVVPDDEPVRLAVTDEGRTASLDLRTGALSKDADSVATLPYHADRVAPLSGEGTAAGSLSDLGGAYLPVDLSVRLYFEDRSFILSPWLPGRGWAAPGRLWGTASVDVESTTPYPGSVAFASSTDVVFTLVAADGTTSAPLPEPLTYSPLDEFTDPFTSPSLAAVWDLPADFTGGTLIAAMAGTWTVEDLPAALSVAPASTPALAFTIAG